MRCRSLLLFSFPPSLACLGAYKLRRLRGAALGFRSRSKKNVRRTALQQPHFLTKGSDRSANRSNGGLVDCFCLPYWGTGREGCYWKCEGGLRIGGSRGAGAARRPRGGLTSDRVGGGQTFTGGRNQEGSEGGRKNKEDVAPRNGEVEG